MTTHGESGTRLYNLWKRMKTRCNSSIGYEDIYVCDEWNDSYESFKDWSIKNGFNESTTIDRIINDGNYEPINCRWTTKEIQAQNTKVLQSNNKSGYRGVHFCKKHKKFKAYIKVKGKQISLKYHNTARDAAIAFNNYVDENTLHHNKNIIEGF